MLFVQKEGSTWNLNLHILSIKKLNILSIGILFFISNVSVPYITPVNKEKFYPTTVFRCFCGCDFSYETYLKPGAKNHSHVELLFHHKKYIYRGSYWFSVNQKLSKHGCRTEGKVGYKTDSVNPETRSPSM